MDISTLHRIEQGLSATAAPIPAEQSPKSREVVQAVKALNQSRMFGEENDLVFQRDPKSRRILIRVVDRKTKEVIEQVPPEYILRLAENLK